MTTVGVCYATRIQYTRHKKHGEMYMVDIQKIGRDICPENLPGMTTVVVLYIQEQ